MMSSIDTNVLIALWDDTEAFNQPAKECLVRAAKRGALLLAAPVYGELMGHPGRTEKQIDAILMTAGIRVDWSFEEVVWRTAGAAFQSYVRRRRGTRERLPRRILTDFLIGAHATIRGCTLLTLDKHIYKAAFPNLPIESF